MGITVANEPSFMLTGQYAYRTARQQAANRSASQQQLLDQKNADRQADITKNVLDNQAEVQKNRDDATADLNKAKQAQELKATEMKDKNAFTLQRDEQLAQQRQAAQVQTFHAQGVVQQEGMAKEVQKVLTSPNLTPEGKRVAGDLMGKLRAIQKQRTILPPDKYGQLMGQWLEEVDRSGIEAHEVKIPDVHQSWGQDSKTLDDGTVVVREKNQNGEWTWKKIADPPQAVKPVNPSWGVEYNNTPEHEIPDDVYFRDPKKFSDAKKLARDKLEAEAKDKATKESTDDKLVAPEHVNEADVIREAIRARAEEKKILGELAAARKEQEKKDRETLAQLGAAGADAFSSVAGDLMGGAADAVFGGGPPSSQQQPAPPAPPQAPAPGKPAVNPPEAAIPPGPAQDGSVTVRNKDGSTVTFADPKDAKKAAKEVGGITGLLHELAADHVKGVKSKASQTFDSMVDGVTKAGKKKPKAETGQEAPGQADQSADVFAKYASVLPEGVGKKYREASKDPKKMEAFEKSPDGKMAINLHLYDSQEQFGTDGKPLIKDLPKDANEVQVGSIYYMPDPKDSSVTHDVIWDGKKFKVIASYKTQPEKQE